MQKQFISFVLVIVTLTFDFGKTACPDSTWTRYKDEKCFKILNDFGTAEEAFAHCFHLTRDLSPVLSIRNAEEQDFVRKFIYEDSQILDNVWVAASRINGTNEFQWDEDESLVQFSNWAEDSPSNDSSKNCVTMTSRLSKSDDSLDGGNGRWRETSCIRSNLIVCQRQQTLSMFQIQNIIFKNRRQLAEFQRLSTIEILKLQTDVSENEEEIKKNQAEISTLKTIVSENEIERLKNGEEISKLKTTVSLNEIERLKNEEEISHLKTSLSEKAIEIANLQKNISNHQTLLVEKGHQISNLQVDISGVQTNITKNEVKISKLEKDTSAIQTTVSGNGVKLSNLQTSTSSMQTTITQNVGKISTLQTTVNQNIGKISALQSTTSSTQTTVSQNVNKITTLQSSTSGMQTTLTQTVANVSTLQTSVVGLKNKGAVPIGFIYVQLYGQPAPLTMWPGVWTEVSSSYSGQFFRVLGSGSEAFGTIQSENAPRLTTIGSWELDTRNNMVHINIGGVTSLLYTGDNGGSKPYQGIDFRFTSGEVRPRNQAVKLWKRTS